MTSRISIVVVLVGLSAGCADEAAPSEVRSQALEPLVAAGPKRSIMAVTWPAETVDEEARAGLSKVSVEAARRSPVPVLVPRAKELLATATVMAEANWYASSSRTGGITVNVSATRIAHQMPGVGPVEGRDSLRGKRGFVTQNEGIWSATWKENGASYVLDVECESAADERCASDAFVRSLVERLAYVGGAGEVSR
jgi:hypothetical protein